MYFDVKIMILDSTKDLLPILVFIMRKQKFKFEN